VTTDNRNVTPVDVVVVSYNSRSALRSCVDPLVHGEDVHVIVVDNRSDDHSLDAVDGLPVTTVQLESNFGFAYACNEGWQRGHSPLVLFLNPDAQIDLSSLRLLASVLESRAGAGAVGPRILRSGGSLDYSIRRFPRLRSRYAQAFFMHRVFPNASWVDEVVRDESTYAAARDVEWLSGACLLVRRDVLEQLGGFDDGFFMYCEDVDLCRRVWDAGFAVRYEPSATCLHEGGASAPRASLLPVLAASRVRYAQKHFPAPVRLGERVGIAVGALTHAVAGRGGRAVRAGHLRALRAAATAPVITRR
jgi:N-acetylglucosaminyl-diphospho-decaprenol L-rhamnosyltransferase